MENMISTDLEAMLVAKIPVSEFYAKYFPSFSFAKNQICPFHQDKNPSLKIKEDGSFRCFGCDIQGANVVDFNQHIHQFKSKRESIAHLYNEVEYEIIDDGLLDTYIYKLQKNKEALERLEKERGWSAKALEALRIGWTDEGGRLTIPYFNKHGFCTCVYLYNVFKNGDFPHTRPLKAGMQNGYLWPIHVLQDQNNTDILMCEGLSDTITALCNGLAAVTLGGASNRIKGADIISLAGRTVNLCYDADEAGKKGSGANADLLLSRGNCTGIRILELPLKEEGHNDLSDYFKEGNSKKDLYGLIMATPFHKPTLPSARGGQSILEKDDSEIPFMDLKTIRGTTAFNKFWRTEAVVVSKSTYTYYVPKHVKFTCNKSGECKNPCPLWEATGHSKMVEFAPDDPVIVSLMEEKQSAVRASLKRLLGARNTCKVTVKIESAHIFNKVLISPVTKHDSDHAEALQVFGYFFGENVATNIPYIFKGYSTPHPKDGSHVAVLLEGKAVSSTLDSFRVDPDMLEVLKAFTVLRGEGELLLNMMKYYDHCADAITGIMNRPLEHMAVDLVFHSPVSFYFNGEFVRKGSLDVLAFGDTRTGKGSITEGFRRHYEHGEVVSGENISLMNLIGGIKALSNFRGLCWGRFVACHRSTLIVDEMSSIHREDLGKLSRIRSEGIAEVDKDGQHQKADANCGVLWCSNPRDQRFLSQYSHGVEALKTLVPAPEDQARFDYICSFAIADVASATINKPKTEVEPKFTTDQCHNLILWAKSRRPDQVEFTTKATEYILAMSKKLGEMYSPSIPLVQPENVRFKLAKVAAAIAARTFNANPSGEQLVVDKKCAKAAVEFLDKLYSSENLGYKLFSAMQKGFETINEENVRELLRQNAASADLTLRRMAELLLRHDHLTVPDMVAILSIKTEYDKWNAQNFANGLINRNCLLRKHTFYVKSAAFIRLLKGIVNGSG